MRFLKELDAPLWVEFSVALVPVCALALLLELATGRLNLLAQATLGREGAPAPARFLSSRPGRCSRQVNPPTRFPAGNKTESDNGSRALIEFPYAPTTRKPRHSGASENAAEWSRTITSR